MSGRVHQCVDRDSVGYRETTIVALKELLTRVFLLLILFIEPPNNCSSSVLTLPKDILYTIFTIVIDKGTTGSLAAENQFSINTSSLLFSFLDLLPIKKAILFALWGIYPLYVKVTTIIGACGFYVNLLLKDTF